MNEPIKKVLWHGGWMIIYGTDCQIDLHPIFKYNFVCYPEASQGPLQCPFGSPRRSRRVPTFILLYQDVKKLLPYNIKDVNLACKREENYMVQLIIAPCTVYWWSEAGLGWLNSCAPSVPLKDFSCLEWKKYCPHRHLNPVGHMATPPPRLINPITKTKSIFYRGSHLLAP